MVKKTTIDAFFKKRGAENLEVGAPTPTEPSPSIIEVSIPEHRPSKASKINLKEIDASSFERDPGLRPQIWEYAFSQRDQLRRAYIKAGPYQHHLSEYPFNENKHPRLFQASWFKLFPDWLEYSPTKDKIFCLPCYLFTKPTGRPGSSAFIVEGFRSWKKFNDGSNCALLHHVGKDPNSLHKIALKCCQDLLNQSQHIEKILEKQTTEQIRNNRLRLETSIFAVKWLTFQSCPLRGHDESSDSINRGNFIEFVKALASHNEEIDAVVLDNAPQNAIYTSPGVQKDILYIFAKKIQKFIREEISDAKYCILVDKSRDESKKEQMAIVLRFVDRDGFIRERFFDLVHVSDTRSMTLKKEISDVLSRNNLSIQHMRGQGYDGTSNIRGEWNGLQALFSNECPFAYYIHCLAHRLQLALVAASREVVPVHQFFSYLTLVVNVVGSSCKRHDQLKAAQVAELERKLAIDDLETGSGLNQVGTLKRAGDTRWGSHLGSLRSLIIMFDATCSVLREIISDGASYVQRGDADGAYDKITSFEFIFILHLMREIMEITDDLCQALQCKSQDILNAMQLVSSTKSLIQKFREDGCDPLFEKVRTFCEKRKIKIHDMSARYTAGGGDLAITLQWSIIFGLKYSQLQ